MKRSLQNFCSVAILSISLLVAVSDAFSQSTDPNFPTALTSNEVNASIRARDVGDPRSTSYYYAFEGSQGDVFVNVVTKNFTGDIDLFVQDGLRSLAKIVIFDAAQNETGRLVYLRKPEKLILRIQGRSPNDDPAELRVKFGGSFVALAPRKEEAAPTISEERQDSETVVNSVGTIVAVKPKATPAKNLPPVAEKLPEVSLPPAVPVEVAKEKVVSKPPPRTETAVRKPEVVVESTIKEPVKREARPPATIFGSKRPAKATPPPPRKEEKPVDPMASFRLVIQMKDGDTVERPMVEILRFTVDKGVLTVISKSGAIKKYSMLNVSKVTMEQ